MTTASPEVTARRRHREQGRDFDAARDAPPDRGAQSAVSPDRLLAVARSGPAGQSSGAATGVSDDLARNLNAARLPEVSPGQSLAAGNSGERPQTGGQIDRGTGPGKNGPAR